MVVGWGEGLGLDGGCTCGGDTGSRGGVSVGPLGSGDNPMGVKGSRLLAEVE